MREGGVDLAATCSRRPFVRPSAVLNYNAKSVPTNRRAALPLETAYDGLLID